MQEEEEEEEEEDEEEEEVRLWGCARAFLSVHLCLMMSVCLSVCLFLDCASIYLLIVCMPLKEEADSE
jgi:hypothetical protein